VARILTLACLAAVAGLLLAERLEKPVAHAVFKLGASSAFVLVALSLDATASVYGRWILAALALSWVGDAALLSRGGSAFLAGLGAFLISHLCFALAFRTGASSLDAFLVALVPELGVGIALDALRDLRGHHLPNSQHLQDTSTNGIRVSGCA